jgi:hypothetical protein
MVKRIAAAALVLALVGCTPVRERAASPKTADVSAATTECEEFACEP